MIYRVNNVLFHWIPVIRDALVSDDTQSEAITTVTLSVFEIREQQEKCVQRELRSHTNYKLLLRG